MTYHTVVIIVYVINVLFDNGVLSCQSNSKILLDISDLVRRNLFHRLVYVSTVVVTKNNSCESY